MGLESRIRQVEREVTRQYDPERPRFIIKVPPKMSREEWSKWVLERRNGQKGVIVEYGALE